MKKNGNERREEERTREKGQRIRHRRGENTPCVNNALVATLVVEINVTGAI